MTVEMTSLAKRLIFWGAVLFLLGMLQGLLIPFFTVPRMAVSAHLSALQSGMAIMIFGVIWRFINLGDTWLKICCSFHILSGYIVWIAINLSAALGASKGLPIAGAGFSSTPLNETLIVVMLTVGAGTGIFAMILVVLGLYKGRVSDVSSQVN